MSSLSAEEVIEILGLSPLDREGGMWAQTWLDASGSAIYFLIRPGDFSALHRLGGPELWHFYGGSPVQMVLLDPDGSVELPILHIDLATGARPFVAVNRSTWMGAYTMGGWSLVGTTMAPPFDAASFELLDRTTALARYPAAADQILEVTSLRS